MLLNELKTIDLHKLKENLKTINKKELMQNFAKELSVKKGQFAIGLGLIWLVWFVLYKVSIDIIHWIDFLVAIPQIILFGVWFIVYYILDALGLITPFTRR